MKERASLTLDLDAELLASLKAAAAWRDMSVDAYVRSVVDTATRMDIELAAFVQEGIDDIDAGRSYTQEQVEAWFEARHRDIAAE
jgi:predicted transcriptional regulator